MAAPAPNSDITGITISPTSSAISTGPASGNAFGSSTNPCQTYTVTLSNGTSSTAFLGTDALNVIYTPSAGIDALENNCGDAVTTVVHSGGAGQPDQVQYALTDNGDGTATVTIGLNADNGAGGAPAAGSISILAYADQNANNTKDGAEPSATATQNYVTAPNQNEVVSTLAVTPTSTNASPGDGIDFTVTASNAKGVVPGATVSYVVKDSQGATKTTDLDSNNCNVTGQDGTTDCFVVAPTPTTSPASNGPYTVTFFVRQASGAGASAPAGSEPTTSATINEFSTPAGTTPAVAVSCGGATTNRYTSSACNEPGNATSETFTANVTDSASTASTKPPMAGELLDWTVEVYTPTCGGPQDWECYSFLGGGGSTATFPTKSGGKQFPTVGAQTGKATFSNNAQCVTDASGSCSVTLTLSEAAQDGTLFRVFSQVHDTGQSGEAQVQFANQFFPDATNIAIAPPSQPATTGQSKVVTAKVTNQFGQGYNNTCWNSCSNASDAIDVTYTITGAGTFSDGTTTKTVSTTDQGLAQVAVISSGSGTSTVSASMSPNGSDCTVAAGTVVANNYADDEYPGYNGNADPTAKAGNCSAQATVTWTKASTTPPPTTGRQGVSVKLACFSHRVHRVTCVAQLSKNIGGVTVVFWDNHGNKIGTDVTNRFGHARIHLHGLKSHVKHRYQAHAKKSSKTRSAWSRFATVFVK